MEADHSEFLKLFSEDGREFTISRSAAILSKLLCGVMQEFPDEIKMPVNEVEGSTLQKIILYLGHWNGEEPPNVAKPIKSQKMSDNCDVWSAEFIDSMTLEEVGDVAIAAKFMEIQSLMDLSCAKIASICFGKSEDDLLGENGIDPSSITEEERQKIKEENADWLEDDPVKFLFSEDK